MVKFAEGCNIDAAAAKLQGMAEQSGEDGGKEQRRCHILWRNPPFERREQ